MSFEDRQNLLGHRSGRVTTHYSQAELASLIEAAEKVCDAESRKSPATTWFEAYFAAPRWMGSIQYTSSTRSAASMLRLTTTDSLSLRINTHSSGVSLERLIS